MKYFSWTLKFLSYGQHLAKAGGGVGALTYYTFVIGVWLYYVVIHTFQAGFACNETYYYILNG